MTNKTEKQFFDTFGIEERELDYPDNFTYYPKITDSILLELICVLGNTNYFLITDEGLSINIDGLKRAVLHSLILQAKSGKNKDLKQQVCELFKEE